MIRKAVWLSVFVLTALLAMPVSAQEAEPSRILVTNVGVFNGKDDRLADVDVLVEGNKITQVAASIPTSGDMWLLEVDGNYWPVAEMLGPSPMGLT